MGGTESRGRGNIIGHGGEEIGDGQSVGEGSTGVDQVRGQCVVISGICTLGTWAMLYKVQGKELNIEVNVRCASYTR
jgi:hypothetical protein